MAGRTKEGLEMKTWFQPCFSQLVVGFLSAFDISGLRNVRSHETTDRARRPGVPLFSSSPRPMTEPWLRIPVAMGMVVFLRHVQKWVQRMSSECSLLLELEDVSKLSLLWF